MESKKKIVRTIFTGSGGNSHHAMTTDDAEALERLLDSGVNQKTFKFVDQEENSKVTLVLDKLFIMEVTKDPS